MTEQRRRDGDRGRPPGPSQLRRPEEPPRDPGAYIGRKPERATATIPGGIARKDVPISAVGAQPAPVSGSTTAESPAAPEGHREGANAANTADAVVREAGQNS